jgi:predicted outer membrane protein
MNTLTLTSVVASLPRAPRGAQLIALLYDAIEGAVRRIEARRAARARTVEADMVRRYARSMQDSDPSFAADLYAAADRHLS